MTEDEGWRLVDNLLALIADPAAAQARRDAIKAEADDARKALEEAHELQTTAANDRAAADKAMADAKLQYELAETKFKEAEAHDERNGQKSDELAAREAKLIADESNAKHLFDRAAETDNNNVARTAKLDDREAALNAREDNIAGREKAHAEKLQKLAAVAAETE